MEMDLHLPFLPEEIITNILSRLPVKSLIRFQCVCNHFKNLIKTPSFIFGHLHHPVRQNPDLIIFQRSSSSNTLNLFLLDRDMQLLRVPIGPSIDSLNSGRTVGSSNGLLCVQINLRGVFPPSILLWNPAIREVIRVPRSRTINDFSVDCSLGFGFCPIANDYKIVITYAKMGDVVSGVEVYSLSTGSWKEIEMANLEGVRFLSDSATANGSIFWSTVKQGVAVDGGDNIYFIVSFDLAMEEFTLIPRPSSSLSTYATLTVYENRLVLLYFSNAGNSRDTLIELWVMKGEENDDQERWSWSKIFTCGPYPYYLQPLTIWRNHIVCEVIDYSRAEHEDEMKAGIFLVNLTSNEHNVFASTSITDYHEVFNYVESLVSVRNNHIDEP